MIKKSKFNLIAIIVIVFIMITGCGHIHSYSEEVTDPTCTEQGYTIYTCLPASICFLMPSYILSAPESNRRIVDIGFLPGGSSSMTDTSKSPYRVMARVRGIGVAVITRT